MVDKVTMTLQTLAVMGGATLIGISYGAAVGWGVGLVAWALMPRLTL